MVTIYPLCSQKVAFEHAIFLWRREWDSVPFLLQCIGVIYRIAATIRKFAGRYRRMSKNRVGLQYIYDTVMKKETEGKREENKG